jgi:hypothetical protein
MVTSSSHSVTIGPRSSQQRFCMPPYHPLKRSFSQSAWMTGNLMCNEAKSVRTCETVDRVALPLEILANLTFLTREHSEHPERVRMYMGIAEEQLARLREVVSSPVVRGKGEYQQPPARDV